MNQNQYLIFYTQNDIESGHVNRMNLDRAGNLVVTGNITSSGSVNITGGLVVTGNIQSQGYVFPGRFDVAGVQGSWYLASHGSYGLYANTGFYLEGGIWTNAVESRNHIRAAAGLYDYARGTPIGVWINVPYDPARFFSTNGTWTVPSANYTLFKYMVVGKTMTISFALGFTTYSGSGNELRMYIPDGFVPTITAAYSGPINYLLSGGNEVGSCIAMSNYITLFRGNAASWPTSPYIHVKGSISFEVN
jgi:hypothetical protein